MFSAIFIFTKRNYNSSFFLNNNVNASNIIIKVPNTKKNPLKLNIPTMIPHHITPNTFARFPIIFKGAAEE